MPIHFIPNDPLALAAAPLRVQPARPEPPSGQAGFAMPAAPPEAPHPVGSDAFLHWQCREAALAALEAWAAIDRPLARWQNGKRRIPLAPSAGVGWNARYDRARISFQRAAPPARRIDVAASTDAVAHEVGHALLDAIRPELWASVYSECSAFHEAFSDCLALLVGFFDPQLRAPLAAGALSAPNFLEAIAEDVAASARAEEGPAHPHALPRSARNNLQWRIPVLLPASGGPSLLTSEPHSLGRIFTGCFYDLVLRLFAQRPQTPNGLLDAATRAGTLLAAGTRDAPAGARFFRAVGRAMVLHSDASALGDHIAIRDSFALHGIALGSSVALAPTASLGGPAGGSGTALVAGAALKLRARLQAQPRARLRVSQSRLRDRKVASVHHRRSVDVRLRHFGDLTLTAHECVLIGRERGGAVVLGELPDPTGNAEEAAYFARVLAENSAIAAAPRSRGGAVATTHWLEKRAGKSHLVRDCFCCGGARADF